MARLALALPGRLDDRLMADIIGYGHTVTVRAGSAIELEAALAGLDADVVLLGAGNDTLTASVIAQCDRRGIRIVALAANDREREHARGLGFQEVLDSEAPWQDIEDLLARVPLDRVPVSDSNGGRVIAVWGPSGAPGRSTLALGIAAELAEAGRSVILIDADSYGGSIAPLLGLLDEAPGFAAACRLAGSDGLDLAELDRIAQRYAGRAHFRVLTGLPGPSRWPELSEDRVNAALTMLRGHADYLVVDTGFSLERDEEIVSDLFAPHRNAATLTALGQADHIVEVGSADQIGLTRFVRMHTELSDIVQPACSSVVINRVRSSVLGVDPGGQVRHTLRRFTGIDRVTLLPYDSAAVDASLLTARALPDAAGRSALRSGIRAFVAADVLGHALEATPARSRWRPWRRAE